MNILLLSDTHGELDKALEIYNKLNPLYNFDMILHCGDYATDAITLRKEVNCKVEYVQGNCDGCQREDFKVFDSPAGKIMITHGHMENVDMGLLNLVYSAKSLGCVAVCYGHTHIPFNELVGGIRFINPGSLAVPRKGSKPSCAIITATEEGINTSIINY